MTEPTHEATGISQWEFIDRVPTTEDVITLLKTLPDMYGVPYVDFAEFVQALPQRKKVKVDRPDGQGKIDQYLETYSLYVTVAGRIKMIEAIANENDWRVSFVPETECSPPGMLPSETRIVYREYCTISDAKGQTLGAKPGMASVPQTGGQGAAGSNPYEKVETAARGRAIAAWGIGVLPGSGVASVEEVIGARAMENRQEREAQRSAVTEGGERMSKDAMIEEIMTLTEKIRQDVGETEAQALDRLGTFLVDRLGVKGGYDPENRVVVWQAVKDGQVALLMNGLRDRARQIAADQPL